MNHTRILYGAITLFLAMLIPTIYHGMIFMAAVQENYSYSFDNMVSHFSQQPWQIWLYLAVMFLTGLTLIISGLREKGQS